MMYKVEIDIMPHKELLDPQGKAVENGLYNLSLSEISEVRIGKHVSLLIEASSKEMAEQKTKEACSKLLANPIMETFTYTIIEH